MMTPQILCHSSVAASPCSLASQQTKGRRCASRRHVEHDDNIPTNHAIPNCTYCIHTSVAGSIMFCDGPCMRAFHCGVEVTASSDDGHGDSAEESLSDFDCNPLGMPRDLYLKLKDTKDILHCPNCLVGVHQCFKCKEEGVVEYHSKDAKAFQFSTKLVFRWAGLVDETHKLSCHQLTPYQLLSRDVLTAGAYFSAPGACCCQHLCCLRFTVNAVNAGVELQSAADSIMLIVWACQKQLPRSSLSGNRFFSHPLPLLLFRSLCPCNIYVCVACSRLVIFHAANTVCVQCAHCKHDLAHHSGTSRLTEASILYD